MKSPAISNRGFFIGAVREIKRIRTSGLIIFSLWLSVIPGALVVFGGETGSTPVSTAPSPSPSSVKFNGQVSTLGELYHASEGTARRPGSTGRISLRSTLVAWNSISLNFNLLLSSEGNSARQSLDQFDFNPKWQWGEAHLGSFSELYSPLTLSGVQVRGGSIFLRNGGFHLGFVSGMTRRAVGGTGSGRSFERHLTAGRVGFGRGGGPAFDIIALSARDNLTSIPEIAPDTAQDTTATDMPQSPEVVTPQENLVLALATSVPLAGRKFVWTSELGGCAITRDRRAAELESSDIPDFVKDIFTPRVGSSADFAATTDVAINIKQVGFRAGYQYIGPGYVSLGLASMISDRQQVKLETSYRLRRGGIRLELLHQNDNLANQKRFTTDRNRVAGNFDYRPTRSWNFNLNISRLLMKNDAPDSSSKTDYSNWIILNNHTISFSRSRGLKMISFNYVYQTSDDSNPLRKSSALDSHSWTIRPAFGIRNDLDLLPAVTLVSSRIGGGGWQTTQMYQLSAQHRAMQQKLMTTAQLGLTTASGTHSWRGGIKSDYRFDPRLTAGAEIEMTSLRNKQTGNDLNEIIARLTLTRSF